MLQNCVLLSHSYCYHIIVFNFLVRHKVRHALERSLGSRRRVYYETGRVGLK